MIRTVPADHQETHVAVSNMKGFTYLETVLYIAILVVMMTTLIPFSLNVITGGAKSTTQEEVASNARFLAQKIAFTIRNAYGIDNIATTSVALATNNPATNPIVFDLSNGSIRMKEGTGSAIALNSPDTTISALLFTNYSTADNKTRNIRFSFTLTGAYGSVRQEYTEAITVQSDAELR